MRILLGIIFIWIRTYREIFKSALVYLIRSKNFYTDQIAGSFKLQYLTSKLKYEVGFAYVVMHP